VTDPSSFDAVAAGYDAARPSYPAEAVAWLVPDDAAVVVDVGAGTGKFTRLLARPGRTVIAVEPSEAMRAALRAAMPDSAVLAGSGERMPLPGDSADALVFAQAWHWVDVPAATREAARVLRPGGVLGLVWNLRDERVEWVRELGAAMRADGDHYRGVDDDPVVGEPFAAAGRSYIEWMQPTTRAGILDMVRSRSYFALLPPGDQARTLAAVEDVLQRHPESAGESIPLPWVTAAYRFTLA
jgi:SAM-dependent methyltransferase